MELNTTYFKKLHEIGRVLETGRSMIDEQYIDSFNLELKQVEDGWQDVVDTNRTLKIGIVGGVKAGKSSFLNALLFRGRDILPKAATPMTAALTKISYSETPYAKIVFYEDKDWNAILQNAAMFDERLETAISNEKKRRAESKKSMYTRKLQNNMAAVQRDSLDQYTIERLKKNIDEEFRACKELTEMANKRGVAVNTLLGSDKEIPLSDNLEADLKEYVGAEGKYTPFVKYIELGMNEPMLKDLEIIDTPGLNDPIVSRSIVTKRFLKNCDAAFLMSFCGQFMSAQDVTFLLKTLPQEGIIGHVVLIGSKFDSVLQEKSYANLPLPRAVAQLRRKLSAAAKDTIQRNSSSSSQRERFTEALPPVFISSLLYTAAQKMKNYTAAQKMKNHELLSEEEKKSIDNLAKSYKDFEKDNPDFLLGMSNIDEGIRKRKLTIYKQERNRILQERSEEYIKQKELGFLDKLNEIQKAAQQNLSDLEELDKGEILKKQRDINRALDLARGTLELTFKEAAFDAKKQLKFIEHEIMGEQNRFRDVKSQNKVENKGHSYTTGHLWWKKQHHYTERVEWRQAAVADAVIQVEDFANEAKRHLEEDLQYAISVDQIEGKLKKQIVNVFLEANVPYEVEDILGHVKLVMHELTLPSISVDKEKYVNEIEEAFPNNVVKDNEVEGLRLYLEKVLRQISRDMEEELNNKAEQISITLNQKAVNFVDQIQNKIQESGNRLVRQLEEKEKNIENCKTFIQEVKQAKLSLSTMGKETK